MKLKVKYNYLLGRRFQKLFHVNREFRVLSPITKRTIEVAKAFGLGLDEEKIYIVFKDFNVDINPGDIVYITGESGGGKSLLLNALTIEMSKHLEFNPVITDKMKINKNEIVIHGVGKTFQEALEILNFTGLNDAFIFLRRYGELSDGQKYRYKLAKALSKNAKTLVFDEFCATLDRETAKVVAYLVQKICRKKGITLIVATTHEDLIEDVNPDILIRKGLGPEVRVEYLNPQPRECSILKDVVIERGTTKDLRSLEFWHYKGELRGYIDKIYCAKLRDKTIGVVAYTLPHLALKARFKAFPHLTELWRKSRKGYLNHINKAFRRLARIIIHPKYRGIGLAVKLVKETMPLLDVPYVECIAVMAKYNPFLEHAGMVRVESETSKQIQHIYSSLEELGFNLDMIQSKNYNLNVLKMMPRKMLKKVQKLIIKMYHSKFKRDKKLVERVFSGDIEAMAEALKKTPIPTAYFIWRNPKYINYPEPIQ